MDLVRVHTLTAPHFPLHFCDAALPIFSLTFCSLHSIYSFLDESIPLRVSPQMSVTFHAISPMGVGDKISHGPAITIVLYSLLNFNFISPTAVCKSLLYIRSLKQTYHLPINQIHLKNLPTFILLLGLMP